MVGILFMLNIGLELLMDWVSEKVTDLFCKKRVEDPENPAALVGTFKRYKWIGKNRQKIDHHTIEDISSTYEAIFFIHTVHTQQRTAYAMDFIILQRII